MHLEATRVHNFGHIGLSSVDIYHMVQACILCSGALRQRSVHLIIGAAGLYREARAVRGCQTVPI